MPGANRVGRTECEAKVERQGDVLIARLIILICSTMLLVFFLDMYHNTYHNRRLERAVELGAVRELLLKGHDYYLLGSEASPVIIHSAGCAHPYCDKAGGWR